MNCETYVNLIDDLVEGELDEQTVGQVNWHIFACPECAFLYESLKQEKEIYAHYLFNVEPSADLPAQFQTKLKTETNKTSAFKTATNASWKTNIFGFLRFYPALASVVLLVVLGIGFSLMQYAPDKTITNNQYVSQTNLTGVQPTIIKPGGNVKDKNDKNIALPKSNKNNDKNKSLAKKTIVDASIKSIAVKAIIVNKAVNVSEISLVKNQPTEEEQLQRLQAKYLEKETIKQIEKIELLLRSFRNARSIEGSETFDVAYEKEQAGKLLSKNVQLRKDAEIYGTLYTEEMLGRVEPFLLDIANLGNNPAPEKVLEIKERVKNQNIIASLQIY